MSENLFIKLLLIVLVLVGSTNLIICYQSTNMTVVESEQDETSSLTINITKASTAELFYCISNRCTDDEDLVESWRDDVAGYPYNRLTGSTHN